MPSVKLPRPLVNQLLHQAQLGADLEVCGLIGAQQGIPAHSYPVKNTSAAPKARFAMDPKEQIDAMRQMRERGEELFAIYHSHPASPALPSAIDLAEAEHERPAPEPPEGVRKRGRIKRSKSRNLLECLRDYENDVLRFMDGAQVFCRIRSYLSTCRKHGVGVGEALERLFRDEWPDFIQENLG